MQSCSTRRHPFVFLRNSNVRPRNAAEISRTKIVRPPASTHTKSVTRPYTSPYQISTHACVSMLARSSTSRHRTSINRLISTNHLHCSSQKHCEPDSRDAIQTPTETGPYWRTAPKISIVYTTLIPSIKFKYNSGS